MGALTPSSLLLPFLLPLFVRQQGDRAPGFPALFEFLDQWRQQIAAALHFLRVAHDQRTRPAE